MAEKAAHIVSVAREAGVSIATVSRVINHPNLVAPLTRQRVLRVIQQNNFRISKEAQLARRQRGALRTGRIGFLVPDIPYRSSESITEEMSKGIQQALKTRGLELVVDSFACEGNPLDSLPRMLRENSVDGLLIRPPPRRDLLEEFCRGRKTVVLGNTFADLAIPCVVSDDWAGMRMVMEYLFELGHTRIGFVGSTLRSLLTVRRLQAYRLLLEARGIHWDERLVKTHDAWILSAEEATAICGRMLDELMSPPDPPTAIVTTSDGLAVAVMRAARERGLRLPDDLSVTGFGDQYYAPFTDPPLTTVHVDQRATGEIGALLLLQLIEGASYSAQTLVLPIFMERRSCVAVNSEKRS